MSARQNRLVTRVRAATVRAELPAPVSFGDWRMTHREFVVVRIDLADGTAGWAFSLTREGAVAAQVRKSVAGAYIGSDVGDREQTFHATQRANQASHAGG
ncbi:hypothetical protein, partial [Xanthobacter autotrophicus]|uniref:hypothetical protein n=1 Tax=Xanthobacter autotrophicus TaxID=280 RepID=UPI0024A6B1A6